jgi:predicted small secreted protein
MKTFFVLIAVTTLAGCGTVGGLVSGAGKDLSRAGNWIQSK